MKCASLNPRTWNAFIVKRRIVRFFALTGLFFFTLTTIGEILLVRYTRIHQVEVWKKKFGSVPEEKSFVEKFNYLFSATLYATMATVSLVGLLGAWRDSFKLTLVYVIVSFLYLLGVLGLTIWDSLWWQLYACIPALLTTSVTLFYLRDLQHRRRGGLKEGEVPRESLGVVE